MTNGTFYIVHSSTCLTMYYDTIIMIYKKKKIESKTCSCRTNLDVHATLDHDIINK